MIRCEVSLDSGETWRRAEIERHEEPTPHNKTWCWVFWSIAVTAVELVRAPELRVRAVDSSQNMMPEKCAPSARLSQGPAYSDSRRMSSSCWFKKRFTFVANSVC